MNYTARDLKLMEKLGQYGVLSTEQVAKTFFQNIAMTTVRRRLRLLEHAKRIYRVHGLDNGGVAWSLTKNVAQEMGAVIQRGVLAEARLLMMLG